ncbi:MAG TPA: tetratricopeptide repeat protein [Steroidobacteraceae bacterium]|jgi:tetratricopeptide (TPR) repeat protein
MPSYGVGDVERVLRLPRSTIRGLIDAGFVKPERGQRREYRFSFRDLIVLRAARALIQAKVPRKRIHRSLQDLRRHLPETMPLSGLSICAVGDRVVVRDGQTRWQADNGQYLLGLDVVLENGVLHMVERPETAREDAAAAYDLAAKSAEQWFVEALELENADEGAARGAYEHAVSLDPHHVASWINLGRLLHEGGRKGEADDVYRRALDQCGPDALLMFNRGVLLEDLGKTGAALEAYQAAIEEDPTLADCHYNLARLYEALGQPQHAIRHLGQYRRLLISPGN